jgi:hypothetical protein
MNNVKQGITPNMATIEEALDVIAAKVPALAARAAKIKSRPNQNLKLKAANALIGEALTHDDLTAKDRKMLAGMVQPVEDLTRSAQIPPVRITQAQYQQLADEADGDMSALIRRKLFGDSEV